MALHISHSLQGLPFTGCSQLTAFARILATVVLPVPLVPQKKICMSDTVCVDLIGKRGHNVILPFDVFKIIGPELSVQGSITHEYTPLLLPGNIIFAEIFSGIKPPQENSRGGRCSLCYNSCQSPKLIPICLAALTI